MGIAILMATYNGEKFITEQIESLLAQTYSDFTLYVGDDGSTDGTMDIVAKYAERHPGKIVILKDKEPHLGAKDSFMKMLEMVEDVDYYMFCDQDDVWLPFKVENTLAKMKDTERKHPGKGVMIHTDLRIVDRNLNTIYDSFWGWQGMKPDLSKDFRFTPICNAFTGCTMMINQEARRLSLPLDPRAFMHDQWIGLKVAKYGVVDNLKEATILYRQHGNNVCSCETTRRTLFHKIKLDKVLNFYQGKNKEMLRDLGYGPLPRAIYYKLLYTIKKMF